MGKKQELLAELIGQLASNTGTPAEIMKYETEEEAIKVMRKLAMLKPGDIVHCVDGKTAVFLRFYYDSLHAHCFYYDEDKEIAGVRLAPDSIVFDD